MPDCIGIFDSGLGGLTVWSALHQLAPGLPCTYFADQAHLPYGPRSEAEIQALAAGVTQALVDEGARLIVVACNTASAAALEALRAQFPQLAFVGMEPAVKPAALATRSGVVGLMATRGTLQGELLRNTARRFAGGVEIVSSECPGLAEAIEQGEDEAQLLDLLKQHLAPMRQAGVDSVVLGCTHYPLIAPLIRQVFAREVQLIDPAPAVARQVLRLWSQPLDETDSAPQRFASSGNPAVLQQFLQTQFQHAANVEAWPWRGATLASGLPQA